MSITLTPRDIMSHMASVMLLTLVSPCEYETSRVSNGIGLPQNITPPVKACNHRNQALKLQRDYVLRPHDASTLGEAMLQ